MRFSDIDQPEYKGISMDTLPSEPMLRPVFSAEQIAEVVRRLAAELTADYAGRRLHLLVVLKGALFFAADLARHLELPITIDFIRISSYCGTESTGGINLALEHKASLRDKDVLIVEDILDTGQSLRYLMTSLAAQQPSSLKSCVLVTKVVNRAFDIEPDYQGLFWRGGFLVGYGLDCDERLRNLPGIYEMEQQHHGRSSL
jgi:hypoxanthine phosphoribosyltransferase